MGLAWTFMGYSTGFNLFTGFFEALGGFLLFFRKTSTYGSLIAITVMSNIVAINFFYDVPVKLFSAVLLLMACFIASPDATRLANFFFLNKPVAPADLEVVVKRRWMRIGRIVFKILFIGFVLVENITEGIDNLKVYGDSAPKPPLYGIYLAETFVINHDTLAPLTTDTTRWSKLVIFFSGSATVRKMNDSITRYNFTPDTAKKTVTIFSRTDTTHKSLLTYLQPDSDHLVLFGKLKEDSVFISMKKMDEQNFLLVNRGFHWINEYPFNK
jgi:hypothetical protein